jgi:hypothetical protein
VNSSEHLPLNFDHTSCKSPNNCFEISGGIVVLIALREEHYENACLLPRDRAREKYTAYGCRQEKPTTEKLEARQKHTCYLVPSALLFLETYSPGLDRLAKYSRSWEPHLHLLEEVSIRLAQLSGRKMPVGRLTILQIGVVSYRKRVAIAEDILVRATASTDSGTISTVAMELHFSIPHQLVQHPILQTW